ncbi:Os10g0421700 [Oryza sativa Japonica Group]|uniref:Os10g0421700 protein n=1 Tax=Oryza sativa subsp. japonica TaxID=39947 RepID=A0A0P0XUS8_ORYSJ|nr:Os10g0421700 [Oryza sativa Japonica Group]
MPPTTGFTSPAWDAADDGLHLAGVGGKKHNLVLDAAPDGLHLAGVGGKQHNLVLDAGTGRKQQKLVLEDDGLHHTGAGRKQQKLVLDAANDGLHLAGVGGKQHNLVLDAADDGLHLAGVGGKQHNLVVDAGAGAKQQKLVLDAADDGLHLAGVGGKQHNLVLDAGAGGKQQKLVLDAADDGLHLAGVGWKQHNLVLDAGAGGKQQKLVLDTAVDVSQHTVGGAEQNLLLDSTDDGLHHTGAGGEQNLVIDDDIDGSNHTVGGAEQDDGLHTTGAGWEQNLVLCTDVDGLLHTGAGGEQNMVCDNVGTIVSGLHDTIARWERNLVFDDVGTAVPWLRHTGVDGKQNLVYHLATATVQSVWRENCMEQFKLVLEALHQPHRHLYIAVDMEFAADAATNVSHRPVTSISCYQHMRRYVNGGGIFQMGLTFAFVGEGEQAPSPLIALEINFDFNVNSPKYHGKSIDFLSSQGHDLTQHSKRGVAPEFVYEGLLRHLPFGDGSVTWVAFHGDYDLAFLLRLLQGGDHGGNCLLPPKLATFLQKVREKFPVVYDVRVLGKLVKDGFNGSLTALAEYLGIPRNGDEHHAGSDALLTLSCFFKIVSLSGHQMHRMDARRGLLAGLEEWNMAIKCARHIDNHTGSIYVVKMLPHKLDEEARRIEELVASNFNIVGVEVIHAQLGKRSYAVEAQQNYELIKTFLKDSDLYEIIVTFMNAEGMLAYSRAWKFCISSRADNACVHPQQFAKFMASCGALGDPNISWVTFHGAHGIARMIRSFLSPQDLPSQWCSYIGHRRAFFPAIYDVALLVRRSFDIITIPWIECKGGLLDVAQALNLKEIEADMEAARNALISQAQRWLSKGCLRRVAVGNAQQIADGWRMHDHSVW